MPSYHWCHHALSYVPMPVGPALCDTMTSLYWLYQYMTYACPMPSYHWCHYALSYVTMPVGSALCDTMTSLYWLYQ